MRRAAVFLLVVITAAVALSVVTCDGGVRVPSPEASDADPAAGTAAQSTGEPSAPARARVGDGPDASARAGESAATPTRRVLVVDNAGRPIPGVELELPPLRRGVATDAAGAVHAPAAATSVRVPALRNRKPLTLAERGDTVLRLDDAKPLHVRVLAGDTGDPVDARVELIVGSVTVPIPTSNGAGVLDPAPIFATWQSVVTLRVSPPPDEPFLTRDHVVVGHAAALAAAIRVTVVLRPVASIPIRVEDTDGAPVADARCFSVRVNGTYSRVRAPPTDANGRTVLTGLAYVRGESYVVRMGLGELWNDSAPLGLEAPGAQAEMRIRLPVSPFPLKSEDALPPTPRRTLRAPARGRIATLDAGSVAVRVVDGRGEPAGDVLIELTDAGNVIRGVERTNAAGVATIRRLPPGRYFANVIQPAFPAAEGRGELSEGGSVTITLRRGAGRRLRVRVLDERGSPVPFAAVSLWTGAAEVSHAEIADGVQELQPLTGAVGTLTLSDVGPPPWLLFATYGTRKAEAYEVEAVGEIVLRLGECE